jgi:hypothetical protein
LPRNHGWKGAWVTLRSQLWQRYVFTRACSEITKPASTNSFGRSNAMKIRKNFPSGWGCGTEQGHLGFAAPESGTSGVDPSAGHRREPGRPHTSRFTGSVRAR